MESTAAATAAGHGYIQDTRSLGRIMGDLGERMLGVYRPNCEVPEEQAFAAPVHLLERVIQFQEMRPGQLKRCFGGLVRRPDRIIDVRGRSLLDMASEEVRYGFPAGEIQHALVAARKGVEIAHENAAPA